MGKAPQVVITGIGAVTPLGSDLESTWKAWQEGRSGVGPITRFDASSWEFQRCAEVKDFDARAHFRAPKALKLADRMTRFSVAAASMAAQAAGLHGEPFPMDRIGVLIGAGDADFALPDIARALAGCPEPDSVEDVRAFSRRILTGLNPLWLLSNLSNMVSAHVAIQTGVTGPNSTVTTDWIAGAQAIGEASCWIRCGEVDAVLAGGADSALTPQLFSTSTGLFATPEGAEPAPFIPGEGAAVLVLEERASATRRGAHIYGEVVSYATASRPPSAGDGGALAVTLERVLRETGWACGDLYAIGRATTQGAGHQEIEMQALKEVFNCAPSALPLIDFKSRIGHTLAASGAVELALMLGMMRDAERPARVLCNALGRFGQAASLAISLN